MNNSETNCVEADPLIDLTTFLEENQDEIPLLFLLRRIESVYGKENVFLCFREMNGLKHNGNGKGQKSDQSLKRGSFSSNKPSRSDQARRR